ncbi:hypothetical protein [Streptomyces sp. B6B3]|uniref:hypothetical protein n=1 Tax=Streptomyces sp. B6B3 TaxID=3153570 RepID=UPI00325D06E4
MTLRWWRRGGRDVRVVQNVINDGVFHGPVVQANSLSVRWEYNRSRRWTEDLASLVQGAEQDAWHRLLGRDTERIDLTYQRVATPGREADNAEDAGRLLAKGIHTYYTALSPRRLVVTGDAGAGKTMIALELLLDLIGKRGPDDPVPVLLPMVDWDPSVPLATHLVERLRRVYGWPRRKGRWLVERGLVLPVLDGLDEMDEPLRDGRPNPAAARARAALEALNDHRVGTRMGPLVLTCRHDPYLALAGGPDRDDRRRRLLDAAHVRVDPVKAPDALAYLTRRATDQARWRPLLDHLGTRPNSPVSRLLSTPWRLCLVATVYRASGNPADVVRARSAKRLDRLLLARYVPATVEQSKSSRHDADAAHRWLHVLAGYLGPADGSATRSVIEPAELWREGSNAAVQFNRIAMVLLGTMFGPPLMWILPFHETPRQLYVPIAIGLMYGLAMAMVNMELPFDVRPRTLRHLAPWRRPLRFLAVVGLGAGIGFAVGGSFGWRWGVFVTCSALVPVFLANQFTSPGDVLTARQLLRGDLLTTAVACLVFAVGFAAVASREFDTHDAVLAAVVLTVFDYFAFFGGPSLRYLYFLYTHRETVPLRLVAFLEWAADVGLLRRTGAGYQFRHDELRRWLAAHPEAPAGGQVRAR